MQASRVIFFAGQPGHILNQSTKSETSSTSISNKTILCFASIWTFPILFFALLSFLFQKCFGGSHALFPRHVHLWLDREWVLLGAVDTGSRGDKNQAETCAAGRRSYFVMSQSWVGVITWLPFKGKKLPIYTCLSAEGSPKVSSNSPTKGKKKRRLNFLYCHQDIVNISQYYFKLDRGCLGQAQGMVLNLILGSIWDFGPNLKFGIGTPPWHSKVLSWSNSQKVWVVGYFFWLGG